MTTKTSQLLHSQLLLISMKVRTFSALIASIYDGQLFWFVVLLRSLDSCDNVINIITASLSLSLFVFVSPTLTSCIMYTHHCGFAHLNAILVESCLAAPDARA